MRNVRAFPILVPVIAWLWLGGAVGGCVSVNTDTSGWQDVAKSYSNAYGGGVGTDKDRAVKAAREAAIEAGLKRDQLSEYQYSTNREDRLWWVTFRRPGMGHDGWPGWFLVRVDPDNKTLIYKVRATAPDR